MRNEVRIFALDRIKMLHQTKETFKVPEDFNLDDSMGSSFGVYQGPPVHIKVWFHADVAGYIREKTWHGSQKIYQQDDGSIIFEAEVAGTDEIRFWIMTWGSKAMVLEPESLREEIRGEAEGMLKGYQKDVGWVETDDAFNLPGWEHQPFERPQSVCCRAWPKAGPFS